VLDCLKTLQVFWDDAQVVESRLSKAYAHACERPGASITITELAP